MKVYLERLDKDLQKAPSLTDAQKIKAEKMAKKKPIGDIARYFGTSYGVVHRYFRNNRIPTIDAGEKKYRTARQNEMNGADGKMFNIDKYKPATI